VRSFDAASAACHVFTFKEGLFAAAGHDLELAVGKFAIELDDNDAIRARFDAASLRLVGDVGDGDRKKIERQAADDVLAARKFPEITFASTRVSRDGMSARIDGTLTLHGTSRELAFTARDDGERWTATITLDQRDFGIKPFSAFLGTLRVRAEVRVRVSLPSRLRSS
jgi:polyisoprenoid-binding protein YceI